MNQNKIIIWIPSILFFGSFLLLGILWLLSALPQLYVIRRSLLDGALVIMTITVVISSILIVWRSRSWIALLPIFVIVILSLLRESRQHDRYELEQIARSQAEEYAAENFGVRFQDGKIRSSDNDQY